MPRITIQKAMLAIAFIAWALFVVMNLPFGTREIRCPVPKCPARLKAVALALVEYQNQKGAFPFGTCLNTDLAYEDRLSWYAEVRPHLDNESMHKMMMWDQPWNEGRNYRISCTYITLLTCINQDHPFSGALPTSYVGIAGLGVDAPLFAKSDARSGVFGYERNTTLVDIKDGTASTMMLAETVKIDGSWLQGGPATVRGLDPANKPYLGSGRQFGGLHQGGAYVAMADGSVRFVRDSISPKVFEAISTMAGGERLSVNCK